MILNQSAIDRGLFRSVFYRSYVTQETREIVGGLELNEVIEKPNPDECLLRHLNYSSLEDDGIVAPGIRVTGDGMTLFFNYIFSFVIAFL